MDEVRKKAYETRLMRARAHKATQWKEKKNTSFTDIKNIDNKHDIDIEFMDLQQHHILNNVSISDNLNQMEERNVTEDMTEDTKDVFTQDIAEDTTEDTTEDVVYKRVKKIKLVWRNMSLITYTKEIPR